MTTLVLLLAGLLPGPRQEPDDPFKGLWKPVDLELRDVPAADAFQLLFGRSGFLLPGSDDIPEKKLSLSLKGVPFWQAADELLRRHGGLRYGGLGEDTLEAGPWTEYPALYRGPLRITVYDVARVRETRYPLRLDRTELAIGVQWTPDLQLVRNGQQEAGSVRLSAVVDNTGESLLAPVDSGRAYDFPAVESNNTEGRWISRLTPASKGARSLTRIEGAWEGAVLTDVERIRFEKPAECVGQKRTVGPLALTLTEFKPIINPAGDKFPQYAVALVLSMDPAAPAEWKAGLSLAPLGARVATPLSRAGENPEIILIADTHHAKEHEARFCGSMDAQKGIPELLIVPVGRNVRSVRVPFSFRNVPLPEERP